MEIEIGNKRDLEMEKLMSKTRICILALCCIAIVGCGKKEDRVEEQTPSTVQEPSPPTGRAPSPPAPPANMEDREQAMEYIRQQMEQMEARTEVMDAEAAYALASPAAKKWDPRARLYQLKGEKKLTPDGTAAMWTAYFAVRTDARSTPSREGGKKLTVLMMSGRVMKVSPKETPEDISYAADCYAFLPDQRLNSKEALAKCLAALKEERGAAVDSAELKRLICSNRELDGEETPTWELSASIDGSPASVHIHAVTGEVLDS